MQNNGVLEKIESRLKSIAIVQQGIPQQIENMRGDMEAIADRAAVKAIDKHESNCSVRRDFGAVSNKLSEATGQITVMRETGRVRRSFAPVARAVALDRVPQWAWRILAVIAIGIAGKFGIDGLGDVIPLAFGGQ